MVPDRPPLSASKVLFGRPILRPIPSERTNHRTAGGLDGRRRSDTRGPGEYCEGPNPMSAVGQKSRPGRQDSRGAGSGTSRCRGTRRCMTRFGRRNALHPAGVHPRPDRDRARRNTARAMMRGREAKHRRRSNACVQRRSGKFPEAGCPGTRPRGRQALKGPKPYERRPSPPSVHHASA